MSQPVVVVVEPADEPAESAPVVAAVSSGELAARLELLERDLEERISAGVRLALDAARDAQETAEVAQETAEVASVVAAIAAENVEQETEGGAEDEDAGGDGAESETEDEGPRPPERRQEQAQQHADGGNGQAAPKRRGYGAGWLSGR